MSTQSAWKWFLYNADQSIIGDCQLALKKHRKTLCSWLFRHRLYHYCVFGWHMWAVQFQTSYAHFDAVTQSIAMNNNYSEPLKNIINYSGELRPESILTRQLVFAQQQVHGNGEKILLLTFRTQRSHLLKRAPTLPVCQSASYHLNSSVSRAFINMTQTHSRRLKGTLMWFL